MAINDYCAREIIKINTKENFALQNMKCISNLKIKYNR